MAISNPQSIRAYVAAASGRKARLKRLDRAAVILITLGGIAVVVAVFGILIFVVGQALPLFRGASVRPAGDGAFLGRSTPAAIAQTHAMGIDEYQRLLYTIESDGRIVFRRPEGGAPVQEFVLPSVDGVTVTAAARALSGHDIAAGLSDGRVIFARIHFVPRYENEKLADVAAEVRPGAVAQLGEPGVPIRQLSHLTQDGTTYVAAVTSDRDVRYQWQSGDGPARAATLQVTAPARITHVRVGRNGALLASSDRGQVFHWELNDEPRLTDVSPVSTSAITAIEWALGGNSWIAGAADGSVSAWFRAPTGPDGEPTMVRAHTFAAHDAPVVAIARSTRERSFVTVGGDGSLVLRHQTSERVLAHIPAAEPPEHVLITPKADAILTLAGGRLRTYALDNPHPETSWRTLFGRTWYEGYAEPAYVWQSTAATDDFEPKFSLVPLVFGTFKATIYAMLFATPLAVLAALYTSQFTDPVLRAKFKPAVEIMAALPSVVIGLLAGLYLAPIVERHLVAVFLMAPLLPLAGTAGVLVWRRLPVTVTGRLRAGSELLLILPLLLAGAAAALTIAPVVERLALGGDARLWLQAAGVTYDQRNCLVVGIAMGFAVIPLIFTISEDAFSSVPASLTAASLALGASRWQTAVGVVLPTASPGIFSATMIGFGRAVGETMIVLMATGNTPLLDWSIFNGARTLSANIAVEIPEAPHGGTLYRILFLAAALLFVLTFIVNTAAELVRQRLRERYRTA